jgi:hypothetical protein
MSLLLFYIPVPVKLLLSCSYGSFDRANTGLWIKIPTLMELFCFFPYTSQTLSHRSYARAAISPLLQEENIFYDIKGNQSYARS